jgi:AcrR family transcriptional regulator
MKIPSQKSMASVGRAPQRHRGRMRVAALMQAAAAVFAEKGFDAATMTEIAALAGAPIGSLYQFFPSKEVLADAVLERYGELIEAGLQDIENRAAAISATAVADALLDLIAALRQETSAAFALLDAHSDWSDRRIELRRMSRRLIVRILQARQPLLSSGLVENMAVVLQHNMRAMAALIGAQGGEAEPGALDELRAMTRLYVSNRLSRCAAPTAADGAGETSAR